MSAMEIAVVRTGEAFAKLRPEWTALLDQSAAGVFNAWEWLYPWHVRLGWDRELFIMTARGPDGGLAGILPLSRETVQVAGIKVRRLAFLGDSHVGSEHREVIAPVGREAELAEAFAATLRSSVAEWDVLDLVDMDTGAALATALFRAFADSAHRLTVDERFSCPYEPLSAAEPFDAFLRRSGRRDNFLRRKRWLERQAGFEIELASERGELARPMAEFFRLHSLRWASDGGSQGIRGPSVEAFHRDAVHYLAERGWLRLFTMRVGGAAVASVYGILRRGRFSYFQSGYEPSWASRSVGLVLVGHTFARALSEGATEYDFLRGTEAYKSDWAHEVRGTVGVRVRHLGGAGEWLARQQAATRHAHSAIKAILPAALVEQVRRARRRRMQV